MDTETSRFLDVYSWTYENTIARCSVDKRGTAITDTGDTAVPAIACIRNLTFAQRRAPL